MKNNIRLLFWSSLLLVTLIYSCKKEDAQIEQDFEPGKNRVVLMVNGVPREYYFHIPADYTGKEAWPVVFMLHGSSGDGLKFYNISGWKEVGEAEGVLTVFPSSMEYCIIEEGKMKRTTKWNTFRGDWDFCPNETGQDDVAFLRTILSDLKKRVRYDEKRVYLAGFSNGGAMATQCAFEMGLEFAAITENSGSIARDTMFQVNRNMPVMIQFGNMEGPLPGLNNGQPFPLSRFRYLLDSTTVFSNIISTHSNSFGLSTDYTLSGDTSKFVIATFRPLDPSEKHELQIRLVNKMDHMYPNGTNHPLKGAEEQWQWMKQFRLD